MTNDIEFIFVYPLCYKIDLRVTLDMYHNISGLQAALSVCYIIYTLYESLKFPVRFFYASPTYETHKKRRTAQYGTFSYTYLGNLLSV